MSEQELLDKVAQQGEQVRTLKAEKADAAAVKAAVAVLLDLKKQYKDLTGNDVPAPKQESKKKKEKVVQDNTPNLKKQEEKARKKGWESC